MPANRQEPLMTRDYDVHGLLGVRVVPHRPDDGRSVARLLGPTQTELSRQPDIIIRFVESLPMPDALRYVGIDAGFSHDSFLLFRTGRTDEPRVQISFEAVGGPIEILCRSGETVPLLLPIINLTMLSKGVLPLHAAAFTWQNAGVLVTGWAKGGKTETLVAFMANGAEYVGDEWVYIDGEGNQMFGLPMPVRVWDWHLAELPQYEQRVPRATRLRWRGIRQFLRATHHVAASSPRTRASYLMSAAESALQDKLSTFLSPEQLSGHDSPPLRGSLDKLIFATSHRAREIVVRRVEPSEVAARMAFSLDYERLPLLSKYLAFRFAFPARANELIDCAHEVEQKMLERGFQRLEALDVRHPYPVSIPALFKEIRPYVSR